MLYKVFLKNHYNLVYLWKLVTSMKRGKVCAFKLIEKKVIID